MRMRFLPLLALPVLSLSSHAFAQASEDQQQAVLIYECGKALVWAEAYSSQKLSVSSDEVWNHFDAFAATHSVSEAKAKIALDDYWQAVFDEDGQDELVHLIMTTASRCEEEYLDRRTSQTVTAAAEQVAPVEYTVAQLQAHIDETGDYASVADYIVYHLPNGKDPFGDSPEGELLGRMVMDAGPKGLIRFSDASILAMVEAQYWQYNPPASRLVDAEYRRRLRVRNYSQAQGRSWGERAARDRAEQARLAKAKPVGSIGKHCDKYLEPAGPGTPAAWVTKCTRN